VNAADLVVKPVSEDGVAGFLTALLEQDRIGAID